MQGIGLAPAFFIGRSCWNSQRCIFLGPPPLDISERTRPDNL